MLNISLGDKVRNDDKRGRSKTRDATEEIAAKKWRCVGKIVRQDYSRWAKTKTKWLDHNEDG